MGLLVVTVVVAANAVLLAQPFHELRKRACDRTPAGRRGLCSVSGKFRRVAGTLFPRNGRKTAAEQGFRNRELAKMYFPPALASARTSASRSRGESVMPGRTGAQITPAAMPAWFSFRTASRRRSGRGARGSRMRASSTFRVVIVTFTNSRLFLRQLLATDRCRARRDWTW